MALGGALAPDDRAGGRRGEGCRPFALEESLPGGLAAVVFEGELGRIAREKMSIPGEIAVEECAVSITIRHDRSPARLPDAEGEGRRDVRTLGEAMAKKSVKKKAARKPSAAFMKPVTPSAALAEVVGSKPIPRTEVTKRLWAYIKKNKLQDSKNKRMIKADGALKTVFGGKSAVNMFEMTKLVSKHLK